MKSQVLKASLFAVGATVLGASLLDSSSIQTAYAQVGSTVGSLRGQIKDKTTGEPALGATVVATSPALVGEQAVITDENGSYFITSLPPGLYTLTIWYNNQPFSRPNVLIQLGKEAVVNVTVGGETEGKKTGEVIEIQGTVPIIDQGSTKTGSTVTDDYTRNVPTGRTFGAVLGSVAGSQGDFYGTSISGATSAENTYIVEGINTTDTGFGGISSNLPNEFIQETEVITGGYNAEFGRATGGIVSVVTKSGSNELHGSVFGYFRPGGLIADAKAVSKEGSAVESVENTDYNFDVGAELGGPIIKDKLWFHVGFNPSVTKTTTTRIVNSQQDVDADGIPDQDENGFAIQNEIASRDIPSAFNTYFFTAKINGAINQNNQFQISAFGNPRNAKDVLEVTRNPASARWKYDDGAYDLSGKFTSKLNEGKTQIDAVFGFHRGYEDQQPFTAADDVPLLFERANHERSLFDFAEFEGMDAIRACQDNVDTDPFPGIENCPTVGYATQGIGFLEKRTNDRYSAVLALTQRVKAAGYHTFKVGLDAEFATYNSTRRYSGGQFIRHNQEETATASSQWQLREFQRIVRTLSVEESQNPDMLDIDGTTQQLCAVDANEIPHAICETANSLQADTSSRSLAGYIQDSWQVLPNLTLNAGLRYEQQVGYAAKALQGTATPTNEIVPDRAYTLDNLLAPRLGFIFDPTKEGKAKIFGHWGRFYENVPLDLNVRAFGGEITAFSTLNASRLAPGDEGFDPNCFGDIGSNAFSNPGGATPGIANTLAQCTDRVSAGLSGEGVEYVTPGLKGQYTQELILGGEYEVIPELKVGLNYIHRSMPQVIEDISTDGGANYVITNPGNNFDGEARDLENTSQRLLMEGNCTGLDDTMPGSACDQNKRLLASLNHDRAEQVKYIKNFDKPVRNYDAVQVTATQRPTKQSLLIASYTYSVSKGNYAGLFSTETNQLDPNLTSLYDLADLMANRYGNLGLDRPHNVKVDGFYAFDFKKAGILTTGGSFRAQSGIPHNVLGASPHLGYGAGESYLLPRGDFGRSPVTSQVDAHLAYKRRLSKNMTIEGFVNIFNLLNQQDEVQVDDNYTFDFVNPIVGGDLKDLEHAKVILDDATTDSAVTPSKNKNFGNTSARQAPRNFQFGARLTF